MSVLITEDDAQGWLEGTKLPVTELDTSLLSQVTSETLAQLGAEFDVTTWVDSASTPSLVTNIISMRYAAWLYDRAYSQDDDGNGNSYADRLRARADSLVAGILSGSLELVGATPLDTDVTGADFFPTDASSTAVCGYDSYGGNYGQYLGDGVGSNNYPAGDASNTPNAFSMGKQW